METRLRIGPFAISLASDVPAVIDGVRQLYPAALFGPHAFADFHVGVRRARGLRRWVRPQAIFTFDGSEPFKPLPLAQALAMFEWGLNQVIGSQAHNYLILHAAAIERAGRVAILPGVPGAGKSTLTAALVHRGWRLLSDELTLLREDGMAVPLARPINLKNDSIGLMRRFVPDGVFSAEVSDTIKGTVALLRAPADSIARMGEAARPGWVIFPAWQAQAEAKLIPMSRADAYMTALRSTLNHDIIGNDGFELMTGVFERCGCYRFFYGRLDDAIAAFAELPAPPA